MTVDTKEETCRYFANNGIRTETKISCLNIIFIFKAAFNKHKYISDKEYKNYHGFTIR